MKKSFELLRSRNFDDVVPFKKMEEKYGLVLPPIYKLFLEFFDGVSIIQEKILLPKTNNDIRACTSFRYKSDPEVGIMNFISDLEMAYESWIGLDERIQNRGMFPIATSGIHSGGIVVGTKNNDADKIFIDTDYKERFIFVANNIFEFVREIEQFEIQKEYMPLKIEHKNLYKNWGEDFWRIRDDEKPI